jgi:membrane protein implicated in regulation of membrane protease activity
MPWWAWMVLAFVLILLELLTPVGFYWLFFGVGALAVGILVGLGVLAPPWVEWFLFSCLSVVALILFRRPLVNRFHADGRRAPLDTVVGEMAVALEDIGIDAVGRAELRGTTWNARNVGAQPLRPGQRCVVERIEGLMLWVRGS